MRGSEGIQERAKRTPTSRILKKVPKYEAGTA